MRNFSALNIDKITSLRYCKGVFLLIKNVYDKTRQIIAIIENEFFFIKPYRMFAGIFKNQNYLFNFHITKTTNFAIFKKPIDN